LTIYGRTDCCSDRDNFNVQIYGASNNLLYSGNLNGSAAGGLGTTVTFDVSAVPLHPSIVAELTGLGLLGLLGWRRRRNGVAIIAA
jgi:hypothetical protein